tara:strand:- start:1698 stop:1844 length:147 start_codon:yes stop_codon:yes gene_type:complete
MKWDLVMLFLILYNVIMVPVRICFEVRARTARARTKPSAPPRARARHG